MSSAWLKRLFSRRPASEAPAPTAQSRRVEAVWARRTELGSAAELFAALAAAVAPGEPLDDASLRLFVTYLRGSFGAEQVAIGGHFDEHVGFWRGLTERTGHPHARLFLADTLIAAGRRAEAARELATALGQAAALVFEMSDELHALAEREAGPLGLAVRLATLRAALEHGAPVDDGDDVRELYGELCEEYAEDPAALGELRLVGREIEEATRRGDLPRAMVRRTGRRPPRS